MEKIEANLLDVIGYAEGGALMSCNLQIGDTSYDTIYWLRLDGLGVLTFSEELITKLGVTTEEELDWYEELVKKLDSSIDDKSELIKIAKESEIGNINDEA